MSGIVYVYMYYILYICVVLLNHVNVHTASGLKPQSAYLGQVGHYFSGSCGSPDQIYKTGLIPLYIFKPAICMHTLFQNVLKTTHCLLTLEMFQAHYGWGSCWKRKRIVKIIQPGKIIEHEIWVSQWAVGGSIGINMLVHMRHPGITSFQSLDHVCQSL